MTRFIMQMNRQPFGKLFHAQEKYASGRKISKDRVTFMPCCNASGTHKLRLLVIGKSINPRSFKNCNVPLTYKATKKGWMSTFLFTEWYRKYFIPDVKIFLQDNNRPLKAILLIDNAPCHPRSEDIDIDTNFRIVFLPPNCTAIIHPLDQNLIQNVKVSYRKQLLNYLLIDNTDIGIALKNFTLRNCVTLLNNAWLGISQQNIVRSWNQLLCSDRQEWMEEDLIPLAQLTAANSDMNEIHTIIASINLDAQVDTQTINDWATGRDEFEYDFSDREIVRSVLENDNIQENGSDSDYSIVEVENKISSSEGKCIFSKAIQWAEQIDASAVNILTLKRLKETADKMFIENSKQTKIDTFFQMHNN
ncbi:tigger transposable element-derived protein 2-like [Bactrocera dorsalis]|uniref:Tigger transposable element-derived protein 2-like n=1 Tax=Bactrocera dorsalis TaxID=27457 RepID=A0ABM3K2X4_BACDO|nr:tigger transposable element-derived protein 2-like [Bactrocera dorsalis]